MPNITRKQDELRIPYQIGNSGIYMETNLSANHIVKISRNMISFFGYSDNDLIIEAN